MKICTLIVRLVGVYLLVRSTIAFIEIKSMKGMMQTSMGGASFSVSGLDMGDQMMRMQIYIGLGVFTGLLCTVFAHFVARLFTFDAPKDKPAESRSASDI